MSKPIQCERCGSELPPDAPAGVCPKCLLQAGLKVSAGNDDATLLANAGADWSDIAKAATSTDNAKTSANDPGTTIRYFGDYELLSEVARGGMGVVYKARQVRLNRMVALKMILAGQLASESDVARFYSEAEAVAKLDHPGIVPIFEVGQHDKHHYYSMAFVEGESLAHRIEAGPLSPKDAASAVEKVARAVGYAHQAGVIHRDLKPANILITADGQPRITDFGLAKHDTDTTSLTETGQVLGTPGFMSPEQASGFTSRVDEAADIYGLGAILYAATTGRAPFQSDSAIKTLQQVVHHEPTAPSKLNRAIDIDLQTVILKCLEKRPQNRYQSAPELAEELQRFIAGKPIHARRISPPRRVWRMARRKPLVAVLMASLVVASMIILGLVFNSPPETPLQENLSPRVAGQLVSEAASIPNEEWTAIANASTMPVPDSSANQSLSLILFSLYGQPIDQAGSSVDASRDFRYASPVPKPYQIAQKIWISKNKGYASFIQPDYITDCTVQQEGNTAHGTVSFAVDAMYSGRVDYVARRKSDEWAVEELHLPSLGLSLQRNDEGKWENMIRVVNGLEGSASADSD